MAEEKRNTAKKRRKGKKRHSSYILLYILLIIIAVTVLTVLSLTVFFPVKSIKVEGITGYGSEEIIDASRLEINHNLFTVDTSKAEGYIVKELPYVESVRVLRKFPSTLVLKVEKATEYAQIELDGKYCVTDKNGKCLALNTKKTKAPLIRGAKVSAVKAGENITFEKSGSQDTFSLISGIIDGASKRKLSLTVVNTSDPKSVWATYENRIVFLFGDSNNLEEKYDYAKKVIEQRKNSTETGTLNLSRIPNTKNQVSFIPGELSKEQMS